MGFLVDIVQQASGQGISKRTAAETQVLGPWRWNVLGAFQKKAIQAGQTDRR